MNAGRLKSARDDGRVGIRPSDPRARRPRWLSAAAVVALLLPAAGACSVRKFAVNKLGNALAEGSGSFASDDDPQLIAEALPFSLKLMESLLVESPRHLPLLTATARGFTQYAYAFVHLESDEVRLRDFGEAERICARARRLYLRARDHGLAGLEISRPGLGAALRADPEQALATTDRDDVPLLYWTAAAWAAATSLAIDDPDQLGDLPIVDALIDRALALDGDWDHGVIHGFLIRYEMNRSGGTGDPAARSLAHFERALELSRGQLAAPFVNLAEAVAVPAQDRAEFERLLGRALAVDADARPEWRLSNLIHQRRARWLLEHADRYILE